MREVIRYYHRVKQTQVTYVSRGEIPQPVRAAIAETSVWEIGNLAKAQA